MSFGALADCRHADVAAVERNGQGSLFFLDSGDYTSSFAIPRINSVFPECQSVLQWPRVERNIYYECCSPAYGTVDCDTSAMAFHHTTNVR